MDVSLGMILEWSVCPSTLSGVTEGLFDVSSLVDVGLHIQPPWTRFCNLNNAVEAAGSEWIFIAGTDPENSSPA